MPADPRSFDAFTGAHASESGRRSAARSALLGLQQLQRTFAEYLLVMAAISVGQRPGSATRPRGTRVHDDSAACSDAASSKYGRTPPNCSRRLNLPTRSAPPDTGGAL